MGLRVGAAFAVLTVVLAGMTTHAAAHLHGTHALLAAGLGLSAFSAALCGAAWVMRSLVRPLRAATTAVGRINAGDLSGSDDIDGAQAPSPMQHSLHAIRDRLGAVVTQVRTGTGNVALNAAQISRQNDALAGRTDNQAASLRHTAAAMEQLTAAVHLNAKTATEAHSLIRAAAARAAHGGAVMREVVGTMDSIRESSHSIRVIIGVIDGLAFQTNILALNAAVEAARAGEQGRGFAVVAAEVRSLARGCADAAREVRALVGASVDQVDAGGASVGQAQEATAAIVAGVQQVAQLIGQIDAACSEQSTGIDTIHSAVARIDRFTQDNAALVKAAAGTSQLLQQHAKTLHDAVVDFRLGSREHGGEDDATSLVGAACEFQRSHGRDALLAEVNRLDAGRFVYRDLYLLVQTVDDAVFVAHGNNPGRIGSGPDVMDVEGKYFAREFARMARQMGEGWVEYKWVHPVTGEVFVKRAYVKLEDDLVIGCSVYRH